MGRVAQKTKALNRKRAMEQASWIWFFNFGVAAVVGALEQAGRQAGGRVDGRADSIRNFGTSEVPSGEFFVCSPGWLSFVIRAKLLQQTRDRANERKRRGRRKKIPASYKPKSSKTFGKRRLNRWSLGRVDLLPSYKLDSSVIFGRSGGCSVGRSVSRSIGRSVSPK